MHTDTRDDDGAPNELQWFEVAAVLDAGFRLAQQRFEECGVITGP